MTIEQDIQQLEDLVKHIEEYVNQGIWNSDQQKEIISEIDEADTAFDRIITEYINTSERPSLVQAHLVSNLQERLHHAEHSLPSHLIGKKHTVISADKGVILYATPT